MLPSLHCAIAPAGCGESAAQMPTVCEAQVAVEVSDEPPEEPPDEPPEEPPDVLSLDVWVGLGAALWVGEACTRVGTGVGVAVVCVGDGVGEAVVGEGVVGVGEGVDTVGVALVVVTTTWLAPVCFGPCPSTALPTTPMSTSVHRPPSPTCMPRFTDQSCGRHPSRLGGTGRLPLGPP